MEDTKKSSRLQSDENTFFQLLGLYGEHVSSFHIKEPSTIGIGPSHTLEVGRLGFAALHRYLRRSFEEESLRTKSKYNYESIDKVCLAMHSEFGSSINHCFQTLYQLFKFIETSSLEKTHYMQFVRAQLSNDELIVMFYVGLGNHIDKDFKIMIENYGMLKYATGILDHHKARYQPSAFV